MDRLHSAKSDPKCNWPTCDFHLNTNSAPGILMQLGEVSVISKCKSFIFETSPTTVQTSAYNVGNLAFSGFFSLRKILGEILVCVHQGQFVCLTMCLEYSQCKALSQAKAVLSPQQLFGK